MSDTKIAHLIGVDPGSHTGLCHAELWKLDPQINDRNRNPEVKTAPYTRGYGLRLIEILTVDDDIPTVDTFDRVLSNAIARSRREVPVLVACELFVFTRTSAIGQAKSAVEMTGALKALTQINHSYARLDATQKPGDAKLVTDALLTELGFKEKGDKQTDHARMAARHVVILAQRIRNKKVSLT